MDLQDALTTLRIPPTLREAIEVTVEEDRKMWLAGTIPDPEETLGHAGWTPYLTRDARDAWHALTGDQQALLDKLATGEVTAPEADEEG